jgi:hypothetical protein
VQGINAEYEASKDSGLVVCQKLGSKLPSVTADLRAAYSKFSHELSVTRTQENYRLAQQVANFRIPPTPIPQVRAVQVLFLNRRYSQEPSQSQNILISTTSGIAQCRVTNIISFLHIGFSTILPSAQGMAEAQTRAIR